MQIFRRYVTRACTIQAYRTRLYPPCCHLATLASLDSIPFQKSGGNLHWASKYNYCYYLNNKKSYICIINMELKIIKSLQYILKYCELLFLHKVFFFSSFIFYITMQIFADKCYSYSALFIFVFIFISMWA